MLEDLLYSLSLTSYTTVADVFAEHCSSELLFHTSTSSGIKGTFGQSQGSIEICSMIVIL